MTSGLKTIVHPVGDLEAAKPVYVALLGQPHTDTPYYVGFRVDGEGTDGQEIGLNPHGHQQGMTGPVGYWHVPDEQSGERGVPADVAGGEECHTASMPSPAVAPIRASG